MDSIQLDEIEISITRKPIRALRLRICPPLAEVRLSVPLRATRGEVLRFVTGRAAWIRHHREAMLQRYAGLPVPCTGEHGDSLHLWGALCRLEICEGARASMSVEDGVIRVHVPSGSSREQRLRVLRTGLRRMLLERAGLLLARWAPEFGPGGVPDLRLRSMRTRWGTCNPRARRIWLSADLVRHSPESLEYVVVHELAHLIERGHGPRFERLLDRCLPDWRARRQALNAELLPLTAWM